ncbi:MAG: nuclear transport factor 2 family protein [Chitinophagaceae bacterium]|nr:nuclear transport factor 2 family protein [Chitinophagaceae bacterium]
MKSRLTDNAETMLRQFAECWKQPSANRLGRLLHEEVILKQPNHPTIHGRNEAESYFSSLLQFVPGLHGEVDGGISKDNILFIEWKMLFPIGTNVVVIKAVDKIIIKEDLIFERTAYFDPSKLIRATLKTPSTWRRYIRFRNMVKDKTKRHLILKAPSSTQ